MNQSIQDLINDIRRTIESSMVRKICEDPHKPQKKISSRSWAEWRKDCGIDSNVRFLTQYEAFLLICRSQRCWKRIRVDCGLPQLRPSFFDLNDYGLPWLQANGKTLGDRYAEILEPSQSVDDPFWGIDGRDLPKVVRAILGEQISESTARDRCLKLNLKYSRNRRYNWREVNKILKSLAPAADSIKSPVNSR